jgi:Ser/Thr protein kinase RdoA (MazF antagonist)
MAQSAPDGATSRLHRMAPAAAREPDPTRWSPDAAALLARSACSLRAIEPESYRLLRFGTNAVFQLVGTPWVLRLRRPGATLAEINRQVDLATWLIEEGFPANRPSEHSPILLPENNAIASFWEWVDNDHRARIGMRSFGSLLARFHELAGRYPGGSTFPTWSATDEIYARLDSVAGRSSFLSDREINRLRRWTDDIAEGLERLDWELPRGVIHGDAHTGNVLATSAGGVLIDYDALAIGPREWDLVPTAVSCLRFAGDRKSIESFASAYGFNLLAWSGWPFLKRLRELYMTTWLLTVASSDERKEEVIHRIQSLSANDESRWHAV